LDLSSCIHVVSIQDLIEDDSSAWEIVSGYRGLEGHFIILSAACEGKDACEEYVECDLDLALIKIGFHSDLPSNVLVMVHEKSIKSPLAHFLMNAFFKVNSGVIN